MTETAINRLWQRLQGVIGRGKITGVVKDDQSVQFVQVIFGANETRTELNTRRLGEYGLASYPPANSDCIGVFIAGDRNNGAIIATGHQASRIRNLQPGEAALYDDDAKRVWLKRDGVHIDAGGKDVFVENAANVTVTASTKVTLDAPLVECTHDLKVDGTVTATTDVVAAGKSLKTHIHSGVTTGGGNTGAPI